MASLTVVVGLTASGKSHYMDEMVAASGALIFDDYMKGAEGADGAKHFSDSPRYAELIKALRAGNDCVLSEILLCETWRRLELEQVVQADVPGLSINWIFFENERRQCEENSRQRGGVNSDQIERELEYISSLSTKYQIPPFASRRAVWSASKS